MRKARILLILGICMAVLPYLGFPYSWKDTLFTILGFVLMFFSYLLFTDYKKQEVEKKPFDNFRENTNFNETEI
ncbi:MAG: hypothetical protein WC847_02725 [Candidatus Paceibacterota bacterium]|jgi:hypothetical protein